jgi:hypothetical protein
LLVECLDTLYQLRRQIDRQYSAQVDITVTVTP